MRADVSRVRWVLPASVVNRSTELVERNWVDDQAVGIDLGNQNTVSLDVDTNIGDGCIRDYLPHRSSRGDLVHGVGSKLDTKTDRSPATTPPSSWA